MAAPIHNVFVGSEIGLLKGVNVCKPAWENLNGTESAKKENEICAMCWENKSESKLLAALKCQKVLSFDIVDKELKEELYDMGKGRVRSIFKVNDCFCTSVSTGSVKLWQDKDNYEEINAGSDLFFTSQNPNDPAMCVTGGKENELKVWNWKNPEKPIFQAKNVRNDWLNLRVPVWVLGAQFIPGGDKIVSCTGYHQVRVYDTKMQRRPVIDMTFGEHPITAISMSHQTDNQVVVGNSSGSMGLLDIRKGSTVQLYKGFSGGIRDIQCHTQLPLIASCGLDRFLRIHDLNSKGLKHKIYLKSRLNCMLFPRQFYTSEKMIDQSDASISDTVEQSGQDNYPDDLEDVWGKMEVIKTKAKHKSAAEAKVTENENVVDKTRRKNKTKTPGNKSDPETELNSKTQIVLEYKENKKAVKTKHKIDKHFHQEIVEGRQQQTSDGEKEVSDVDEDKAKTKGKRKASKPKVDMYSPVKTRRMSKCTAGQIVSVSVGKKSTSRKK